MSQDSTTPDGAWFVARLLAGTPVADIDTRAVGEPWAGLTQAIAEASTGGRLAAFEHALSKLPDRQAAEVRAKVGKAGRAILQGSPDSATTRLPDATAQSSQICPRQQDSRQKSRHRQLRWVAGLMPTCPLLATFRP